MGMCAYVGLCMAMQADVWLCRLVWMNVGSSLCTFTYAWMGIEQRSAVNY